MSDKIHSLDDFLLLLKGVKPGKDGQFMALCTGHTDHDRSLSVTEKNCAILLKCFAGCELTAILKPLNLEPKDLFLNGSKPGSKVEREILAVYHYVDANGKPFEVVRFRPKAFKQRQPNPKAKNGYDWNLKGIIPTLYHQDELPKAMQAGTIIYVVEGEKDTDNLRKLGFAATTNPMGAGKWRDSYSLALKGADLVVMPDKDQPGRDHASQVIRSCYGKARRIRLLELPGEAVKDASDWISAGGTREHLENLASQAPDYKPAQLDEILNRAKHWLFMPDTGTMELALGTVAANRIPGDPVWLLLVGTPGSGKTETLNCLTKTKDVHQVAILTEASLLSGTPKRDAEGAKGGLLREVGGFGILQVKDFGSVLSLNRDSRGPILAALREVYDGAWTRYVGSDGGRTLAWTGKCGLIGGATPSIDGFYAVMSILGERFAYYRLPETDEGSKAEKALVHAGHEEEMRSEMAKLVADFFANLDISKLVGFTTKERDKLIQLAVFTTRCRSAVERDSHVNREITLIPGAESPTRLVKVLAQLLRGLQLIGITKERAWELVQKVALDSMPVLRQKVILAMLKDDTETVTSDLAIRLGYPTNTTRRTLEDLACYGILKRASKGAGNADLWSLTDWTRKTYTAATTTLPEIREGDIDNSSSNKISKSEERICGEVAADDTTGELPDCPACGRNEWTYSPDGELLCPCGHKQGGVLC